MTERIADPQAVCPFVALDDDRDHRAPVPDHRHRCYAESPAAPRALAHQAAYCLSGAFPRCPTFVDWARREAAPVKVDAQGRSLRAAGPTRATAAPADGRSVVRPGASPDDWTAPPPWASSAAAGTGSAGGAGAAGSAGADVGAGGADDGAAGTPASAAGRADSAATPSDDLDQARFAWSDGGLAGPDAEPSDDAGADREVFDDTPAFLAGRPARPAPAPAWDEDEQAWSAAHDPDFEREEDEPGRPAVAAPRRMPVGYAPVAPGKGERRAGGTRRDHVDPSAPSWEQPRHFEEYPSLKSRARFGIPRLAVYALAIVLIGAALFAAPFLLKGIGGGGEQPSPTPGPSASVVPSAAPSPTAVPTPEQVVHIVKSGDSLFKIAGLYGVTVDQILAANPSITNPNKIAVGDRIVIPQPLPSEIVEITPAP